jgi:hypothetical protein
MRVFRRYGAPYFTHGKDSCWIVTLGSTCFRMRRWSQ